MIRYLLALVLLISLSCRQDGAHIDATFNPGMDAGIPSISSISNNAGVNIGGKTLTINGNNFRAGAVAKLGNTNCANTAFVNSTRVVCTTPAVAGTGSLVDVSVVNSDGTAITVPSAYRLVGSPAIWLRADDMNGNDDNNLGWSNGAAVGTWADSSGNSHPSGQGAAGLRPVYTTNQINGKPSVIFDQSNDAMIMSYSLVSSSFGIIIVYSDNTGSAIARRAIQGSYDWYMGPYNALYSVFTGSATVPGSVPTTTGSYIIHTAIQGSGTTSSYINGTLVGSHTPFQAPNFLHLGASTAPDPLGGGIAEVFVFDAAVSATQRTNVQCYLSTKYGIAVPGC